MSYIHENIQTLKTRYTYLYMSRQNVFINVSMQTGACQVSPSLYYMSYIYTHMQTIETRYLYL